MISIDILSEELKKETMYHYKEGLIDGKRSILPDILASLNEIKRVVDFEIERINEIMRYID